MPPHSIYSHVSPVFVSELSAFFSRGNEVLKDGDWVWVQNEVYQWWTLVQIRSSTTQRWRIPICEIRSPSAGTSYSALATECLKQGGRVERAVVKMQRIWKERKKYRQRRATDALVAFVLMLARKRTAEEKAGRHHAGTCVKLIKL